MDPLGRHLVVLAGAAGWTGRLPVTPPAVAAAVLDQMEALATLAIRGHPEIPAPRAHPASEQLRVMLALPLHQIGREKTAPVEVLAIPATRVGRFFCRCRRLVPMFFRAVLAATPVMRVPLAIPAALVVLETPETLATTALLVRGVTEGHRVTPVIRAMRVILAAAAVVAVDRRALIILSTRHPEETVLPVIPETLQAEMAQVETRVPEGSTPEIPEVRETPELPDQPETPETLDRARLRAALRRHSGRGLLPLTATPETLEPLGRRGPGQPLATLAGMRRR